MTFVWRGSIAFSVKYRTVSPFFVTRFLGIAHLTVQEQEIIPGIHYIVFFIKNQQYNYTAAIRRNQSAFIKMLCLRR